jgi:hydroxypyruvate isomerase
MPKFTANFSMLFTEYDFLTRFEKAASVGFRGVEYLSPYDFEKREIADQLQRYGLKQVLFNLPAGDWAAGERGIACLPDRTGEFQDGVGLAIEYAAALDCTQINCLAGIQPDASNDDDVTDTLVSNLKFASEELGKAGIRLLLEPINTYDLPGFFVNTSSQGLSIIDEVESGNLFLQYDIYHMQRMEGELAKSIEENLSRIAHIQIADNPGRHEPGSGEINYEFLLPFIDRIGYTGWVGCEYVPAQETESGLGWMKPYRAED